MAFAAMRPIPASIKMLIGVSAMLSPLLSLALEIGNAPSVPVLGQPLHLEIPLGVPSGTSPPTSSCVRLKPRSDDKESDFFPGGMRATIETGQNGATALVISSSNAITTPVVGFRVHIGCDGGVARDFILLSSPPREIVAAKQSTETPKTAQASPIAVQTAQEAPARDAVEITELRVSENTTLNKLARELYPSSRDTRDEYRRLMAQANPGLFAGAHRVGSVPIPAGTVLKIPPGLPKGENETAGKVAVAEAAVKMPVAVESAAKEKEPEAKPAKHPPRAPLAPRPDETAVNLREKKTDRLVIGGGRKEGQASSLSQQEIKQSLERLEQMVGERSHNDLVMSETLKSMATSFSEVKNYLQSVDERVRRAEAEQVKAQAELQQLRQRLRNSFGLVELLAAVVGGGAMGAALMIAFQRLSPRRRPGPWEDVKAFDASPPTEPVTRAEPSRSGPPSSLPQQKPASVPQKTSPASIAGGRSSRVEPSAKPAAQSVQSAPATPASKPASSVSAPASKSTAAGERSVAGQTPPKAGESKPASTAREIEYSPAAKAAPAPSKTAAEKEEPLSDEEELHLELTLPPVTPEAGAGSKPLSLEGSVSPLTAEEAGPSSVDPVLELADVMTSLGLAKEAASAVVEHIRQNKHQDPMHWFKVLDIYRKTGHREAFDEAVQELRQKLNISIDWETGKSLDENTTLEAYPHLIRELIGLWGKPGCDEFLTHLLEDNRGGKRVGFPQAVAEEIVLLRAVIKNLPPPIDFPPIDVPPTTDNDKKPGDPDDKSWREMRLIR